MLGLDPFSMVIIGVIAVLLFGGNLPEVARKFGGTYRELRRGLNDVQQQFRMVEYEAKRTLSLEENNEPDSDPVEDDDDWEEPSAPKFKPPQ